MRRRTLLITGGAAVVITGAGWVQTRAPKFARAPWREASDGFGDPRLDILAYAILAPNPHNMQPWQINLDEGSDLTVFCDPDRLLPETDPPNRQITIGFGCFLELAHMAAAEKGYSANIEYFPEGEPFPQLDERPIAKISLVPGNLSRNDLFNQILSRRTNRAPFDLKHDVSNADLAAFKSAAGNVDISTSNDVLMVQNLRELTVAAWRTEWETPRTRRESIDLTRIGKKEINEAPHGLALAGPLMDGLGAAGVLTRGKMDEPGSTAYDQSLAFYEKACQTAMAYAWIKTAANTRINQLETGRAWVRAQLAANARGLAFHPLSQALQEFPEMAPHYGKAHRLLGAVNGETVQMLARLGYAKDVPPAPREALKSKIISL